MEPLEVRKKIRKIEEHITLQNILVKSHLEYLDPEEFDKRIAEQKTIIDEAVAVIRTLRQRRKDAVKEIGKIEQWQRYERRQLIILRNYKNIQLLKKMAKDVKKMSKETHDGEKHNDTQT